MVGIGTHRDETLALALLRDLSQRASQALAVQHLPHAGHWADGYPSKPREP